MAKAKNTPQKIKVGFYLETDTAQLAGFAQFLKAKGAVVDVAADVDTDEQIVTAYFTNLLVDEMAAAKGQALQAAQDAKIQEIMAQTEADQVAHREHVNSSVSHKVTQI